MNLSPKIALPLLAVIMAVTLLTFAPTPVAEAGCGASYSGYWLQEQWFACSWDFGCWINPIYT